MKPADSLPSAKFGRTDARYWRAKVFRHSRRIGGEIVADDHYSARIAFAGRRERFNTGEREKAAAAAKAAEIYRSLDRFGWEPTLEQFKPRKVRKPEPGREIIESPTIGQFFAAVRGVSDIAPKTQADYCRCFRQIVAEIEGMDKGASRFDAHHGGAERWRAGVDETPLSAVTPERVQKWKLAFVAKAAKEPTAETRAKVSVNSIMRQAKGLFSQRVLSFVRDRVRLPEPLPFAGVDFYKKLRAHFRYKSSVDAAALLTAARDELGGSRLEEFKILVLAVCCGLRRNEIDKLTWRQVDFDRGVIRIETTRWFKAKSEESNADVDLEPELVALLRGWKAQGKGEFVIQSDVRPRLSAGYGHYRTQRVLDALGRWLRSKGLEDRKYLHTLRKEYGSLVADKYGIYAASRALRHADVQVTAMHYLDKKQRIAVGLGAFLAPSNVVAADFGPEASKPQAVPDKKPVRRRA